MNELSALARGVAERLGAPESEKQPWCFWAAGSGPNKGGIRPYSWLWSPEGCFWLLGQMREQGWDWTITTTTDDKVGVCFLKGTGLGDPSGASGDTEIGPAVLRAAAKALRVSE